MTALVLPESSETSQQIGSGRPVRPGPGRGAFRRAAWTALVALLALVVATVADYGVLNRRIDRTSIAFPGGGQGTTWVIVGDDSRSSVPAGPHRYGTLQQMPNASADIVLVVHEFRGRTTVLSVPRDMVVSPAPGQITRLALTLNNGPQSLVNGLCRGLGIPATHFAMITMAGFANIVNAVSGVTVTVTHPTRDTRSKLFIRHAGQTHLDGVDALAFVRSRHTQQLINGSWRGTSEVAGARRRASSAALVMSAVTSAARSARTNPLTAQRLAWAATGGMTVDNRTSLLTLARLRNVSARAVELPAKPSQQLAVLPDDATRSVLRSAGYGASCTPSRG